MITPVRVARTVGMAAVVAALSVSSQANACIMPNGSDDAAYRAYGSSMQGDLLQFRIKVPGVGTGKRDASAAFLNSWYALTAAHNFTDLLQYNPTYEVATGDNLNTNRGTVVQVESVTVYPGFDVNDDRHTPDLAIIKFAEPITTFTANTIAAASPGQILVEAGFGIAGTQATGQFSSPRDGYSRAWNAPVADWSDTDMDRLGLWGYSGTYYGATLFGYGGAEGVALNGGGKNGDSGGPFLDLSGNLVGLAKAAPVDWQESGYTVYLELAQPDIYAWIQANTAVPEPSSLALLGIAAAGLLARRRRR